MDPILARKLNLVSTICFIGLGGLPHERVVFAPEGDASAGGGAGGAAAAGAGGGGGGTAADPPKFTQADLDRFVEDRVKKTKAEAAEAKAKLEELSKAQAELQARADELELKGKSAEEKARIAAEKAAKQIEADKAAALKLAADSDALAKATNEKLRTHILTGAATEALIAAKALPDGMKHATRAFLADAQITTDADHAITAISVDGIAHKTLGEAAAAWLKANPVFAAHTGGAGTRGGAGGNTHGGKPLHEMSTTELLALDAQRQR